MTSHYERAFRFLESRAVRRAFNLHQEPAGVRERYGNNTFGQSCLLARRLAEAGVPLITVYWNSPSNNDNQSWDTHTNSFERLRRHLLPYFDQTMSALVDDLHDRGLLDETLVTWSGEFGRTPRINSGVGRDHWGFSQSILLAGGGVRGGLVYGSSDAHAAYAAELPVSPDDLAATVFDRLGIPLDQELHDAQGRPLPLCVGRPVRAWF
jgi:arylsulfatase A-like enzyme